MGEVVNFMEAKEKHRSKNFDSNFRESVYYLLARKYYLELTFELETNKLGEILSSRNNNYTLRKEDDPTDKLYEITIHRMIKYGKMLERVQKEIEVFLQEISEERRKQFFSLVEKKLCSLTKNQEQEEIDSEHAVLKKMGNYFFHLRHRYG